MESTLPEGRLLSTLLEEEYFLLKILTCVLDEDIRECRLVCRRWYEASRKLPVKLKQMHMNEMQRITEAFPAVTSLPLQNDATTPDILETHLIPYLPQLRHLQHLKLAFYQTYNIPESLVSSLRSVERLQSLSVKIDAQETFYAMTDVLRELQNLTALAIYTSCRAVYVDPMPVTELQRLQTLIGNTNILFGHGEELRFPSLTQLTRLEITSRWRLPHLQYPIPKLQVMAPYASSLRSLHLGVFGQHPQLKDWSILRSFSRLEKLAVVDVDEKHSNFAAVLSDMHHLTEFFAAGVKCESVDAFMESVFSLVHLQALVLRETSESPFPLKMTESLTAMTQLTRLVLSGRNISGRSLRCLTSLVDLHIQPDYDLPPDFPYFLASMPNLESLKIVNTDPELRSSDTHSPALRSSTLAQLRKLKTLTVIMVDVEYDFFDAVGTLPDLTKLHFEAWKLPFELPGFYFGLTALSNVRELKLWSSMPFELDRRKLQGSMKNLRELWFRPETCLFPAQEAALMKTFPSLRRIKELTSADVIEPTFPRP